MVAIRMRWGFRPGQTKFTRAPVGGGGFVTDYKVSPDGLTRLLRTDVHGAYCWDPAITEWFQIITQDSMPAPDGTTQEPQSTMPGNGGTGYNCYDLCFAPSQSSRCYMVAPGQGVGVGSVVYISDDRCRTWTKAGPKVFGCVVGGERTYGVKIAVDPENPDIVILGDSAGLVWLSVNAGATWSLLTPLAEALINITATHNVASGLVITLTAVPSIYTTTRQKIQLIGADIDRYSALGETQNGSALSSTATSITLQKGLVSPGIAIGDRLVFGYAPTIAFDTTSGTIPNPHAGGTGVATKRVYFGFGAGVSYLGGSTGVWKTEDANQTFAQMPAGGPASVRRMEVSLDGVVAITSNGPVATDYTNLWRWVGEDPPIGSGLTANTWTNLSPVGAGGNPWQGISWDPFNPGRLCAAMHAGNLNRSDNYGTTWYGYYAAAPIRVANDVPWLAFTNEDWFSTSNIAFDPIVENRLWNANGIGIWWTNTLASNARPTWTSQTIGNDELIVDDIIWPPGADNRPIIAVQDRGVIRLPLGGVYPPRDGPRDPTYGISIQHGWAVDYAKTDPSMAVAVVGRRSWKTLNNAQSAWTFTSGQLQDAIEGGAIACQTPLNYVYAGLTSQNGWFIGYTLDGGVTLNESLFEGGRPATSFFWYLNRKIVSADHVNRAKYFLFSYNKGLFRSTDYGATFQLRKAIAGFPSSFNNSGVQARLHSVPGREDHVFFGMGSIGGFTPHPSSVLGMVRSVDGGANIYHIPNVQECWTYCFGKAKPGKAVDYPTLLMAGYANGDSSPGIYRCDDITDTLNGALTFTKVAEAPGGKLDTPFCMAGSQETYGRFVIGFASSGVQEVNVEAT